MLGVYMLAHVWAYVFGEEGLSLASVLTFAGSPFSAISSGARKVARTIAAAVTPAVQAMASVESAAFAAPVQAKPAVQDAVHFVHFPDSSFSAISSSSMGCSSNQPRSMYQRAQNWSLFIRGQSGNPPERVEATAANHCADDHSLEAAVSTAATAR